MLYVLFQQYAALINLYNKDVLGIIILEYFLKNPYLIHFDELDLELDSSINAYM